MPGFALNPATNRLRRSVRVHPELPNDSDAAPPRLAFDHDAIGVTRKLLALVDVYVVKLVWTTQSRELKTVPAVVPLTAASSDSPVAGAAAFAA